MSRPKCPNHTVEMDPTGDRRIWICPVSAARFECEADWHDNKKVIKQDINGKTIETFNVKQTDGGTGG